jgi:hypothetical protein
MADNAMNLRGGRGQLSSVRDRRASGMEEGDAPKGDHDMHRHTTDRGTALDLLEHEDITLRSVFNQVLAIKGSSVEERAEYGDLAKTAIRHVATREAALTDVAGVVADVPDLDAVAQHLERETGVRRSAIDRVEKMSRGVPSINLNTGQAFDHELTSLMQIVGSEIEWDLAEGIPAVRSGLEQHGRVKDLQRAGTLAKRAPTNLHPDGPRWWERAPLVSRLITRYDQLRDFPQAVRAREP